MLSSNQSPEANALERYYCAANVHFEGGVQDDNLKEMWLTPEEKLTYEVRIGDLLVVEGGAGAGGSAIVKKQDGKVYMQNSILRLRPGDSADNRYLVYWIERLVKSDYMGLVCNKATIPHFTKQKLGFTQMPLPPLDEQRRIADKLDKICGIVDELRANIEKEIAALGEYRKSLITRCVTKGIPVGRGKRPRRLKPSGVDWIGDAPEGWTHVALKRVSRVFNGREIPEEVEKGSADAVPVYGSGGVFKYTNQVMYSGEAVLFGRKGTIGKPIHVIDSFWAVDTIYLSCFEQEQYVAKYAYYCLEIFDWDQYVTHTAIPSVVANEVFAHHFPLPPLDEQREIAAYLDLQCAAIDAKVAERKRQLGKLAEYRKSVIYEYVTGKKEA